MGKPICLEIKYSAGHYEQDRTIVKTPRSGFHFIQPDAEHPDKRKYQAWTQGESTESRYWFPCFDHPELKFPWEIHVIVPEEFVVISNGILEPVKPYIGTVIMPINQTKNLNGYGKNRFQMLHIWHL